MDHRLLLGVGPSGPSHVTRRGPRPAGRTGSLGWTFSPPLSAVGLVLLVFLCGCGQSAAPRAAKERNRPEETAGGSAAETPPDGETEEAKSAEGPPGMDHEQGTGEEPGAKLEYRLPDEMLPDKSEPSRSIDEPAMSPPATAAPAAPSTTGELPEFGPLKPAPTYAGPKAAPAKKSTRSGAKSPSPAFIDKGFSRVRIFYATDRLHGGDTPNDFYSDQRRPEETDAAFELGHCDVSIPYKHDPGEVERPSVWKLEFRENPAKHVVLLNVQPLECTQWQSDVRDNVSESAERAALVFVHGFNVDFASAARRTAQMKFDLGFQGAAILYSWPAPSNYVECEGNAVWTLPHLMEFLTQYVHQSGAEKIHLVAHSMGTRVLTEALKELAGSQPPAAARYNQIVLAAPDIDAAIFKRQIAPRIVNTADRISIYSSSQDWALVASKKAHRYKRLGEGGENVTTFPEWPQIEVLDATNVDESLLGHSYYGDSPTILRDVRGVLAGVGAAARGLKAQASYYLFNTKRTQLSQRPK
jgi:esterase/lipase superfamily enzyme